MKTAFFVSTGTFSMRKSLFIEFTKLCFFSGYELKRFGVWATIYQQDRRNCFLRFWRNTLGRKCLEIFFFIVNFWRFMKICGLSSGSCNNIVMYALYVSKWTFRARSFPWKFYEFACSSGLWEERCRSCDKRVSAGSSKLYSTCPEDHY